MKSTFLIFLSILLVLGSTAFAQYHNQTADIYASKEGNLYVKASYTSTNMSRADKTIYLKSRNVNSGSKDMINWTNGGYAEVRKFMYTLIDGLSKPQGTTFQVGYVHSANVMDTNNLKVMNTMGGFSYFNKTQMLLLLQAIKGKE